MDQRIAVQLEQVLENQKDHKATLAELAKAVSRLAVIEERQSSASEGLDRAFTEIRELENGQKDHVKATDVRLKRLEEASPITSLTNGFVMKMVGLVLSAVVGGLLVGVLRPPPQTQPAIMFQGAPAPATPQQTQSAK